MDKEGVFVKVVSAQYQPPSVLLLLAPAACETQGRPARSTAVFSGVPALGAAGACGLGAFIPSLNVRITVQCSACMSCYFFKLFKHSS